MRSISARHVFASIFYLTVSVAVIIQLIVHIAALHRSGILDPGHVLVFLTASILPLLYAQSASPTLRHLFVNSRPHITLMWLGGNLCIIAAAFVAIVLYQFA